MDLPLVLPVHKLNLSITDLPLVLPAHKLNLSIQTHQLHGLFVN